MGVHGLTTWISKRSTLGTTVIHEAPGAEPVPLVLDGLAFLYHTALFNTLAGGDYRQYRLLLSRYVSYWRSVGLEPIFIFDGPYDESKLATALHRSQQRVDRSVTYFRRSDEERMKHWVQKKAERLPVLILSAAIAELKVLNVRVHFAEFEADSCVAEMAERLSGYGASNDSDYFIFPSCGKGYVPLTSFEYGPDRESHLSIQNDPTPSLRFTTFTPATTARLLSIPPTFLPIFASLIGNDQSDYFKLLGLPNSRPRFVGEMDPASLERIARKLSAASALPADTPAEVEIILRTTVLSLLEGKPIEDVEMIPTLLRSAHSYRLQPVESESPTFPLHPTPNDTPSHAISRATYLKAFQHGQLGSLPLVFLKHGLVDPPTGVDDPDRPSPSLVFGAPIRLSIYAILAHELHTTRTEVTEHNRWRDRLVVSTVAIPSLAALVQTFDPPLSLPAESISTTSSSTRLSIYLSILSAPPFLRPPPPSILPHLPLVLALLHIQRFSSRPWPRSTILSALLTSILLDSPVLPTFPPLASPPRRAFIHTSAILATVLFHISVLAEVLGLVDELRPVHECFEGSVFHALLEFGEGVETVLEGLPDGLGAVATELLELFEL